ncbi:hypothetical protein CYMTET_12583 [Cymbomonas tetramitiformis]|uniref:Uncharacterized protein n=1 Tax=Cymbomonas tetramitiformis TaxID=36881 RepID=A0AAE0GJR4_9CHLO|nr:hypothetical protein CYMTET_12583 [Cymbomonas tetramitiformis]
MDCYVDMAKTMECIQQVEDALKYYVKVACKGFIALNPRKGFDERKAMFHLAKTYKCMNFDTIEAELRLWRVLAYESITALKSKTSDLDAQESSSESVGAIG